MQKPNRWLAAAVIVCTVTVVAGFAYFGSLESQSTGLCTLVAAPGCNTPDTLNIVSSWIDTTTSVTLQLFHSGQHNLSLSSYDIKDNAGNLYNAPYWLGPTFPANTRLNITFTIDGNSFTFHPGNSYTLTSRTSQGNTVTFTVTI